MEHPRHLLSLRDLSGTELSSIVQRGAELATDHSAHHPLRGRIVATLFTETSTRTRTAFTSGALRLGADVIAYGPGDLQLNTGENVADTARVLGGMVDAVVARTTGPPEEMRTFAAHVGSVVNAMSADEHPTQALADLTTIVTQVGEPEGLRMLYVGEGNNTAAALALALPRFANLSLELRTPPGYGVAPRILAAAEELAARSGSRVHERHDLSDLPPEADVVYTTRWQTTGTTKPDPHWRQTFGLFQVNAELMARYPAAAFMHDLPAHRGEEVTGEVLDGPQSIAFAQAQHKLYSAMAVLEWCLSG